MKGFLYEQSTGVLSLKNGSFECPLAVGSAGNGDFRNDPDADGLYGQGPLPKGHYRMQIVAHKRFAKPAIFLKPFDNNDMKGRSMFYIHGGTKSEGCPLFQLAVRRSIASLMDHGFDVLTVKG